MRGGALRDGKRVGESKGGVRRATSCVSQPSSLYSGVRFQLKLRFITVPVRCFLTSQPAVACARIFVEEWRGYYRDEFCSQIAFEPACA